MALRRILFVIHYPVFGGPHNQALRLAEPLRARGWETVALLPTEPGNAAGRLRDAGIDVVTMPLHRLRASADPRLHLGFMAGIASEIQAIRRLIRRRSIDLVQVGGLVNPHAAIAAHLEGVPVVWQLLDTRAPLPLAIVSMAFVRTLADVVMSTGRSVVLSHPGGARIADRTVPFFPPVDVELFRPRPEERGRVRSEWGVPQGSPVVGCVANINPQKGIVDLVRAFALVHQRVSDARLVLVGAEYATQAAYSATVRAAVTAAGLIAGRDVIFAGERSDVERQLAGMDVFAFAPVPRGEGISTVVLEAMSSALPVVATAVAGLPEAIEDGISGHLVSPDDHRAMADAVAELLMTPATSARVGERARRRAIDQFGIAKCVDDHVRAYEMALTRPGATSSVRPPGRSAVERSSTVARAREGREGRALAKRGHRVHSGVNRAFLAAKSFGRRRLPFLHPVWMMFKGTLFRLRFRSIEARFNEIFRGNHWRNAESVSGFGSSLAATVAARRAVTEIVERYSVTSLLDAPCGDFNWMRHVDFKGSYCGADIVSDLVAMNQARYGDERTRFVVLDVTRDPLPRSDLILCRDCLNHLSIGEAARALGNILESGSSYVALTHYPTTLTNRPQESGLVYRPLNLERAPFNWPPPLELWDEPPEPGKTLALWRIDLVRGQ